MASGAGAIKRSRGPAVPVLAVPPSLRTEMGAQIGALLGILFAFFRP
jgi:hypothetical protein